MNCLARIYDLSELSQWRYVNSDMNLAHNAMQGLAASKLMQNSCWINDPGFWECFEVKWLITPCKLPTLSQDFSFLKKQATSVVKNKIKATNYLLTDFHYFPNYKLKLSLA